METTVQFAETEATKRPDAPKHGDKGRLVTYDRVNGNCHARCTSYERWCASCQRWVHGTGPVSMVLGAIGCPHCNRTWE